jgi:hypothetical protein
MKYFLIFHINANKTSGMKKLTDKQSKISAIIGIILFLIPLSFQIIWFWIFFLYDNQAERVEKFKIILPTFFYREPRNATWLFIVFCLVAIILLLISLKQRNILLRILSIVTLVLSNLMLLLLLFSLM